uniref:Uncharacterized protein n=1 Tax=Arundo donax TaxID=35708 RepID=A0A0A8ZBA8_ARUDO
MPNLMDQSLHPCWWWQSANSIITSVEAHIGKDGIIDPSLANLPDPTGLLLLNSEDAGICAHENGISTLRKADHLKLGHRVTNANGYHHI